MTKLLKTILLAFVFVFSPILFAAPVDINSASADELSKSLAGIGPAKAKAIVEYRDTKGPFKSADDLKKVKGIGKATIEKNRASIVVGGAPSAPAPVAKPAAPAPAPVPVPAQPAAQ